jgi:hypothetical protein
MGAAGGVMLMAMGVWGQGSPTGDAPTASGAHLPPALGLPSPGHQVSRLPGGLTIGGYYRFWGWNRALEQPFRVLTDNAFANTPPRVLGVGDVYRDPPIMLMNLGIRPGGGASLGMDWAMYGHFLGIPGTVPYNLNLGVNFYGSVPTRHFLLGFQLGGIHWTELSGMTLASFPGYERYSLIERWPWEGIGSSMDRGAFFFERGTINRDARWARQAFKGAVIDLSELPGGLEARVLWGKTPATALFEDPLERYTAGGRLRKALNPLSYLGVNHIQHVGYTDVLADNRSRIEMWTLDGMWSDGDGEIAFEGGMGHYETTENPAPWGSAFRIRAKAPRRWWKVPVELEFFRLSPRFVNYFANFFSPNAQALGTETVVAGVAGGGATAFGGSLTDVGQIQNNRIGFNVNAWFEPGPRFKWNLGWSSSRELESGGNRLSMGHKINGLQMSRFVPFTQNMGPYRRWNSFYRGVSEDVFITDLDPETGLPSSLTSFNMVQLHLKQLVGGGTRHPALLNYVLSAGSVADRWTPVPVWDSTAYLRAHYHELDAMVRWSEGLDLAFFAGWEQIRGNHQLNNLYYLDAEGVTRGARLEPGQAFAGSGLAGTAIPGAAYAGAAFAAEGSVDQQSWHWGAGLDVRISSQAGLYIRHHWFTQQDQNFTEDRITGSETSVELKIFF